MPLDHKQRLDICIRNLCFMDFLGNIYYKKSDDTWIKIGRIYYKEKSNLYHITNQTGKNLEGQKSFEEALKLLVSVKPDT